MHIIYNLSLGKQKFISTKFIHSVFNMLNRDLVSIQHVIQYNMSVLTCMVVKKMDLPSNKLVSGLLHLCGGFVLNH